MPDIDWDALSFLLEPWSLALLGLCIGSFINVVVHRMPRMMERQWWADVAHQLADADSHKRVLGQEAPRVMSSVGQALNQTLEALPALGLSRPASRCPQCGHRIRWYENIPLLSWLALRGRCSSCQAAIAWRYPLTELACGLGFGWLGQHFGPHLSTLAWCAFLAVLLTAALIDWDTTLLPDDLTQPLLWAGLLACASGLIALPLADALWGAVAGYLSLWSVANLFKLATGKEGMGQGDFKLLAALGAWLGPGMLLPIVLGASLIGAAVGIGLKMTGGLREGRYVPFGPFLAGGGLVVLMAGRDQVLRWMGWA